MKTLHLTVTKKWFDKIASGEKDHEYRECKKYWIDRLTNAHLKYDKVNFKNGYQRFSPLAITELKSVTILKSGIDTDLKTEKPVFDIHFKLLEVRR